MLYLTRHARRSRGFIRFNELSVLPTMTSHPSIRKSAAKYAYFKTPTGFHKVWNFSFCFVFWLGGYDYKYKDVISHTILESRQAE